MRAFRRRPRWWPRLPALGAALAALAATAGVVAPGAAGRGQAEHSGIFTVDVSNGRVDEVVEDTSGEGVPIAPSWSGDGRFLVYARLPCDGCASEIRRAAVHGGSDRELGAVVANGLSPSVSAAGVVVFVGLDRGLYAVGLAGGTPRRVLTPAQAAPASDQPNVSPDGRRVVFIRHDVRGRGWIETVRIDGSGLRRLTAEGSFANPAWAPDGRRVAFARQGRDRKWRIWIASASGRELRVVGQPGHSDSYPTWSPDGRRLAFVRQLRVGHAIYVVNVDGSGLRRLTPPGLDAIEPSWSPRGDLVAFAVNGDGD